MASHFKYKAGLRTRVFFGLQNDGGINSDWCILRGNYFHLLGKGGLTPKKKKKPWLEPNFDVVEFVTMTMSTN
jgi:hypothetical protein